MLRKYKRSILRARAEKAKASPSKFIHDQWTKYQLSFRSDSTVAKNKAHGTAKKRNWRERVSFAMMKNKAGVA